MSEMGTKRLGHGQDRKSSDALQARGVFCLASYGSWQSLQFILIRSLSALGVAGHTDHTARSPETPGQANSYFGSLMLISVQAPRQSEPRRECSRMLCSWVSGVDAAWVEGGIAMSVTGFARHGMMWVSMERLSPNLSPQQRSILMCLLVLQKTDAACSPKSEQWGF